jgi:hypothetical protein
VGAICGVVCLSSLLPGIAGWTARSLEIKTTQQMLVNRAHKGDRLPLVSPADREPEKSLREITTPNTPPAASELQEGCESSVSSLANELLARLPSRCVS